MPGRFQLDRRVGVHGHRREGGTESADFPPLQIGGDIECAGHCGFKRVDILIASRADRNSDIRVDEGLEVGQVAEFGVTPSRFDRIEFRSISRQPLKVDMLAPRGQNLFGGCTMYTPTIQHDDQGTAKAAPQGLDKRHRFGRANVVGVNLKRRADSSPLGRKRHGTDHAQPVIPIPGTLHRSLATGRPRLAIHGLQTKAGFINKCNGCAKSTSFFLIRGQSFLSHRSTASASCSRATRRSFWGVYPRSCKMRPRWSGWYETRNCLRTTLATRAQVHKSVLKPAATGPAFSMATSACFWSGTTIWAWAQDVAWRLEPQHHLPATHVSNASRWKDSRRQVGRFLRETSVPGNTPQHDDVELPAPPHCLWFS